MSSYKFHITNWYTNRLINITTHPNGENPFILDGSDGLTPDQVYSLVIEAVNSVGSTLSEEIMFCKSIDLMNSYINCVTI